MRHLIIASPFTGILCHGVPGCGKTSFIKALLKYTKRHAVVFSINRHTSLETVDGLMRTERINNLPIPQEERIYIFEDIDAMGDLVRKRKKEEPVGLQLKHQDALEYLGKTQELKKNKKKSSNDDKDKINHDEVINMLVHPKTSENNLSFLLNILDGVIEVPGRMIVMTTNFVDTLDHALIRPGKSILRSE